MEIIHKKEKEYININEEEQKIKEEYYKKIIKLAGGKYIGMQKRSIWDVSSLVLFNDFIGSTKALTAESFSLIMVQKKLNENVIL